MSEEKNIITDIEERFVEFMNSLPDDSEVEGIKIKGHITASTRSKEIMDFFDCYNIVLSIHKERVKEVYDKRAFLQIVLDSIKSAGELSPQEALNNAFKFDESTFEEYDPANSVVLLSKFVMDDIRNGANKELKEYAYLFIAGDDEKGQTQFDISNIIHVGVSCARVKMEALIKKELRELEYSEKEEYEDKVTLKKVNKSERLKTTQLIIVLDALGIIDFLIDKRKMEFITQPDYTLLSKQISKFTGHSSKTIRPILRELKTGGKNDPYNSTKNIQFLEKIKKELNIVNSNKG